MTEKQTQKKNILKCCELNDLLIKQKYSFGSDYTILHRGCQVGSVSLVSFLLDPMTLRVRKPIL